MTHEVLGDLGQGEIKLIRTTDGPPPENPWDIPEPVEIVETIKAAARGIDAEIVGTEVGGSVLLATDLQIICAVPDMGYEPADALTIDGKAVTILSVQKIPAAGTTAAVKFIVRG